MTNLKPVNIRQNKFCGPAVLSILTGKSTDECATIISKINGQYNVTGVSLTDLLKALDKLGFEYISISPIGSLFRTLTSLIKSDGMYVVMVPGHYVCIEVKEKQIYFCDNHTKEPIPAASSARLQQAVIAIYKVIERPKQAVDEKTRLAHIMLANALKSAEEELVTAEQHVFELRRSIREYREKLNDEKLND